jgi:sacsin
MESLSIKHQEFVDVKDDLKSILFLPRCNTSCTKLICINDALMTDKPSLLVPWMKEYSRFINPEFAIRYKKCLLSLDIKKIPEEKVLINHILPLPELLSGPDWQCYKLLIGAMSQIYKPGTHQHSLGLLLKQRKVAADRKNTFCQASNLFDHEDQIFTSAFRIEEESKFLHNDIKAFRSFWVELGLRHREHGILNPADYLQCLQAMRRRIVVRNTALDAYLESDCLAVLAPLITPSSSVQTFGPDEWLSISQEAVFLTQTDFNIDPEYRRVLMVAKATQQQVLCLSEIVSHDYAAVCWSQTPFAVHEPTKEVLSKVSSNGKPSIAMVWKHLESLKELSQNLEEQYIQSFLADLHSSYAYIQDHLHDDGASYNIGNAAIWLNLNSAEGKFESLTEVHSSWTGIKELVLSSSCDAGRMKAVRPGLMRFENLLRALGCHTIFYPTVTRPVLHYGSSVLASLQKLRGEGKLLDVKFLTEGKYIEAHRVVLAAVSEKCAVQFSGRWPVESVIKCGEEEDPVDYLSYHTLSTMINYAYEDKVDWSEMELSDTDDPKSKATKLDMLLDLLKGADYWLIPALKSQVENKIIDTDKEFLNIQTATIIQERAAEGGSKAIEDMCIQFIELNRPVLEGV